MKTLILVTIRVWVSMVKEKGNTLRSHEAARLVRLVQPGAGPGVRGREHCYASNEAADCAGGA